MLIVKQLAGVCRPKPSGNTQRGQEPPASCTESWAALHGRPPPSRHSPQKQLATRRGFTPSRRNSRTVGSSTTCWGMPQNGYRIGTVITIRRQGRSEIHWGRRQGREKLIAGAPLATRRRLALSRERTQLAKAEMAFDVPENRSQRSFHRQESGRGSNLSFTLAIRRRISSWPQHRPDQTRYRTPQSVRIGSDNCCPSIRKMFRPQLHPRS
jgi:hypothetical protein